MASGQPASTPCRRLCGTPRLVAPAPQRPLRVGQVGRMAQAIAVVASAVFIRPHGKAADRNLDHVHAVRPEEYAWRIAPVVTLGNVHQ